MDPDEVDIYGDLDDFDLGREVEKLKTENKQLGQNIVGLEQNIEAMQKVIAGLKTTQANLKKNISALFLTAQTEIARKDRMIAELRTQVDDMCFRRQGIPRADNKRKEQENNPLDVNTAKKFKYDDTKVLNDLYDEDEDRRKSTSRNARDTQQMNPRDTQQMNPRAPQQMNPRDTQQMNPRDTQLNRRSRSRSRKPDERYRDARGRRYDDRVRRADDRDGGERYRRPEERRGMARDDRRGGLERLTQANRYPSPSERRQERKDDSSTKANAGNVSRPESHSSFSGSDDLKQKPKKLIMLNKAEKRFKKTPVKEVKRTANFGKVGTGYKKNIEKDLKQVTLTKESLPTPDSLIDDDTLDLTKFAIDSEESFVLVKDTVCGDGKEIVQKKNCAAVVNFREYMQRIKDSRDNSLIHRKVVTEELNNDKLVTRDTTSKTDAVKTTEKTVVDVGKEKQRIEPPSKEVRVESDRQNAKCDTKEAEKHNRESSKDRARSTDEIMAGGSEISTKTKTSVKDSSKNKNIVSSLKESSTESLTNKEKKEDASIVVEHKQGRAGANKSQSKESTTGENLVDKPGSKAAPKEIQVENVTERKGLNAGNETLETKLNSEKVKDKKSSDDVPTTSEFRMQSKTRSKDCLNPKEEAKSDSQKSTTSTKNDARNNIKIEGKDTKVDRRKSKDSSSECTSEEKIVKSASEEKNARLSTDVKKSTKDTQDVAQKSSNNKQTALERNKTEEKRVRRPSKTEKKADDETVKEKTQEESKKPEVGVAIEESKKDEVPADNIVTAGREIKTTEKIKVVSDIVIKPRLGVSIELEPKTVCSLKNTQSAETGRETVELGNVANLNAEILNVVEDTTVKEEVGNKHKKLDESNSSSKEEIVETKIMHLSDMKNILLQSLLKPSCATSNKRKKTSSENVTPNNPIEICHTSLDSESSTSLKAANVTSNAAEDKSVENSADVSQVDNVKHNVETKDVTNVDLKTTNDKPGAVNVTKCEDVLQPRASSATRTRRKTILWSPSTMTTRRRITPTPVKDAKPPCSFENILEKSTTQSDTTTNKLPNMSPLHLTHEGEIPVLQLEENHISNLPTESNVTDKNIINLLDTMNISNMEEKFDIPKLKTSGDATANSEASSRESALSMSPITGEKTLTFANMIRKVTSTPMTANGKVTSVATTPTTTSGNSLPTTASFSNTKCNEHLTNSHLESSTSNLSGDKPVNGVVHTTGSIRKRRRCRLVIMD